MVGLHVVDDEVVDGAVANADNYAKYVLDSVQWAMVNEQGGAFAMPQRTAYPLASSPSALSSQHPADIFRD